MKIDIQIDKLTPCLIEVATGNVLQTTFSVAKRAELEGLQKKGWYFNWVDSELEKAIVYKLQLKDDDVIQGLVAAEIQRGAVYVHIVESAPHNQKPTKKFEGVGGHLFAIAMKLSLVTGGGGFIYFDAKNTDLVKHYAETLGAIFSPTRIHDYRMEVQEEDAEEVINRYTLEGDLDVR